MENNRPLSKIERMVVGNNTIEHLENREKLNKKYNKYNKEIKITTTALKSFISGEIEPDKDQ